MAECSSVENASEEVFEFICGPCSVDGDILQAIGYCSDCHDYLCDLCFKTHIRPKPMRHHVLLDEKSMPNDKMATSTMASNIFTERCEKHSGNIIEYYCQSHDFLGCTKCFISDNHRKCDGVLCIQDTASGIFDSQEYKSFEGKIQQLEDVLSESSSLQQQNDENIICAKKDIKNFSANMNEYLDGLENEMDKQVSQVKDRQSIKLMSFSKQIGELEKDIKAIKDTMERTRNLGQKSNVYIYMKRSLEQLKRLEDRIETVKNDSGVSEYTFTSNAYLQKIKEMTKTFGTLTIMDDKHLKGAAAGHLRSSSLTRMSSFSNQYIPPDEPFSWAALASKNNLGSVPPAKQVQPPHHMMKRQDGVPPSKQEQPPHHMMKRQDGVPPAKQEQPPQHMMKRWAPGYGPRSYVKQEATPTGPNLSREDVEQGGIRRGARFPDSHQIFVGNLPHNVLEKDIRDFFEEFGHVVELRINTKNTSGKIPNFGFVVFDSPETVQTILNSKPIKFKEHRLCVEEKKTRGCAGRGGFGGRGSSYGGKGTWAER